MSKVVSDARAGLNFFYYEFMIFANSDKLFIFHFRDMWSLSYWAHSTSQHQRMVVCFLHDFGRVFCRLSIIRIIWIWGKNRLNETLSWLYPWRSVFFNESCNSTKTNIPPIFGILVFLGGSKWEHWLEITWYDKCIHFFPFRVYYVII